MAFRGRREVKENLTGVQVMKMLMSDYEVTLVNDNSKKCLLPRIIFFLATETD